MSYDDWKTDNAEDEWNEMHVRSKDRRGRYKRHDPEEDDPPAGLPEPKRSRERVE